MSEHQTPALSDYRQVVLTGGPGAGKTAILEMARKQFCRHVFVVPEAASIIFGGGFPRSPDTEGRRAAQRAIYSVQRELENFARTRVGVGLVLCDRGTVDGAAYWPGEIADYWPAVKTTAKAELDRYRAVIHVHTPSSTDGYNWVNSLRTETAEEAASLDKRIALAWTDHPFRFDVPPATDFLTKARDALEIIESFMPESCSVSACAARDPGK